MKVFAITMVRNEQDAVGYWIDHTLSEGFDGLIIADNLSDDDTRDIIEYRKEQAAVPIIIIDDKEPGYYQSQKMTSLALYAHQKGANWVFPLDVDEIIYCMDRSKTVAQRIKEGSNSLCIQIQVWNHFASARDPNPQDEINPFKRLQWRQKDRLPLFKSAYDYRENYTIAQGNHNILDSQGIPVSAELLDIGIRHFPYRSPEQFISKVRIGGAAYAVTNLPEDMGAHWRRYKQILDNNGEQALIDVYNQWFNFELPEEKDMCFDPAPFCRHLEE